MPDMSLEDAIKWCKDHCALVQFTNHTLVLQPDNGVGGKKYTTQGCLISAVMMARGNDSKEVLRLHTPRSGG